MKCWFIRIVWVLLGLFVAIQFVPVDRTNPPVTAPMTAPPAVNDLLRRACFDCHSNETIWPWYAYVAPASWLVARDVVEGRKHLNLSTWGDFSSTKRESKASEMAEEVEAGEMPPSQYLLIHRDAVLTPEEKHVLRAWADEVQ